MRESSLTVGHSGLLREWIIFALCLGFGGHIVLGIILHDPAAWPWSEAGLRGLLVGLFVYVVVQALRSLWWLLRSRHKRAEEGDPSF